MAFDLKKVLKALLFSSSQPLAAKDIQAAFNRFHELAAKPEPVLGGGQSSIPAEPRAESLAAPSPEDPVGDPPEVAALEPIDDNSLYRDVPSLVTAAQIREAMDAIAAEIKAADEGLLLIEGSSGYRLVTHPRFGRWVRILRQEPLPAKLSQSSLETLAVVAYRQPVTRLEIETIRGVSAEAGVARLLERELIAVVGRADLPGRPWQYATTDRFLELLGIKSLEELPASDVLTSRQIDEWLQNAANPRKPGDAEMGLEEELLPLETAGAPPVQPDAQTEKA